MIAGTLKGVVSQRLVPDRRRQRPRRRAARSCVMTGRVRDMIIDPDADRQARPRSSPRASYYGMQTFDQALLEHLQAGRITMEDAMQRRLQPARLQAARRRRRQARPPRWTTSPTPRAAARRSPSAQYAPGAAATGTCAPPRASRAAGPALLAPARRAPSVCTRRRAGGAPGHQRPRARPPGRRRRRGRRRRGRRDRLRRRRPLAAFDPPSATRSRALRRAAAARPGPWPEGSTPAARRLTTGRPDKVPPVQTTLAQFNETAVHRRLRAAELQAAEGPPRPGHDPGQAGLDGRLPGRRDVRARRLAAA